jgi:hypothetical protein
MLLGQTIIAAQKKSWDMFFDMIQQYLIRQKRVAKAVASGKRPPRWYPIFSRASHFQSSWPPSQRTTSYATSFISSGEDITSAAFNAAAPFLGIPVALRACTWLRVVQTQARLGKAGVALVLSGLQAPREVVSTTWLPPATTAAALSPPVARRRRR